MSISYTIAEIASVGDTESDLKAFGGKLYKVPNGLIVPIKAEETVQNGDLVISSKYGNNMERAMITDASDPTKIKANFIETMPYGENIKNPKPGHYTKLTESFQPGAVVAGAESKHGKRGREMVIAVTGDQVLTLDHSKLAVSKKTDLRPVPLTVTAKVGDDVFVPYATAGFKTANIQKIDSKTGHYHVKFPPPFDKEIKLLPFGEAIASLD